ILLFLTFPSTFAIRCFVSGAPEGDSVSISDCLEDYCMQMNSIDFDDNNNVVVKQCGDGLCEREYCSEE
ncbi:hypothetical protein PMAYCL1PPCAC_33385, partial [Pristionchus mayeri]